MIFALTEEDGIRQVEVTGSGAAETTRPSYQLAAGLLVSYARADEQLDQAFDFDILQVADRYDVGHDIDSYVGFLVEEEPLLVGFSCYVFNVQLLDAIAWDPGLQGIDGVGHGGLIGCPGARRTVFESVEIVRYLESTYGGRA